MNKHVTNLNNTYYESLEENFNHAIELFETESNHFDLINLLQNGNILQKQIAALKISKINNCEEAKILCSNLTGQDGKIRETTSLKLIETCSKYKTFFQKEDIYNIFLDAIIDVNPNVCRNMLEIINIFKNEKDFIDYFIPKLIKNTNELIKEVKNIEFQDGKYKINKEVFKLYWCLEAIYELIEQIPLNILKNILVQTTNIDEYTIREKTAKILSKDFDDEDCRALQNTLRQDKNYYVRRY